MKSIKASRDKVVSGFTPPPRAAALLFLLTCMTCSVFGDDNSFQINIITETGVSYISGKSTELVYMSPNGTALLSRITYPIPPGLGAYVGMGFQINDFIGANVRIETAWPLMTGVINNDDWIDISSMMSPNVHSESTAYLTNWMHGSLEIGFPTNPEGFSIDPSCGLSYRHMSWEGWHAYQVSDLPEYSTGTTIGYVLDYRQTWLIPWAELSISNRMQSSIISGSIKYSPWMLVHGRDVHLARTIPTTFIDVMTGGNMVSGCFAGELLLGEGIWLSVLGSFDYCFGSRGDTFMYLLDDPDTHREENGGGASLSMFSAYLGITFRQ